MRKLISMSMHSFFLGFTLEATINNSCSFSLREVILLFEGDET